MTLEEYLSSLKGKRVAVVGYGVSNAPLTELLLSHDCDVTVRDKRTPLQFADAEILKERGAKLRLGENYLRDLTEDVIFRTPGLHPFTPELVEAVKNGSVLTSEMEAFFKVCPCHTIAVTGSDGKTTTSTLIATLLKESGHTVYLGGNIGAPLLDKAPKMHKDDFAVLELSSFQLHSMKCKPETAVITNISPNHLDVHPTIEDYIDAKKNIYKMQDKSCRLVLNADDAHTPEFASEAKSDIHYFAYGHSIPSGCFCVDELIYSAHNYEVNEIDTTSGILIPGVHNVENFMAAYAATDGYITDTAFRHVAKTFPGVAHRIELIREWNGVKFYNDSIASSPTRTIAGLRCFTKVKPILIAGGHDKFVPFDELGTEIVERVKALYLTGETAERIKQAVLDTPGYNRLTLPIYIIDDFKQAVLTAANSAEEGDVVILSPACSSFDKFKNFVERGNTFRSIVLGLE